MSQIKSRNWTKKQDSDLLTVLEDLKIREDEATWNRIADMIKQRNPSSRKTGKQCRERWANQLNPGIKRTQTWTEQENQTLFRLHFEKGNKWSQICNQIPGRTDNCVKNHFYSTMRRGMRKINSYIENIKRKNGLAKMFKNQILNKILAISEGKNDNKYQFTNQAKQLALLIKEGLIKLALQFSEPDEDNLEFKEKVYGHICEFSRNCRKKKAKKLNQISQQQFLPKNSQIEQQIDVQKVFKKGKDEQGEKQKVGEVLLNKNQKNSKKIQPIVKTPKSHKVAQSKSSNYLPSEKIVKTEKNILIEPPAMTQKQLQINPFPYVISGIPSYESFFDFSKNAEEINQDFFKHSQKGEVSFLESIPEIGSRNSFQKFKGSQSGAFLDMTKTQTDLSKQSQYFSDKISTTYPEMMKSSELQPSYNISFSYSGKESQFSTNSLNMSPAYGISFSPGINPFGFCTIQPSFSYFPSWPVQQQKLKSSVLEQSNIIGRQQIERDPAFEIKSSFKTIKRQKLPDNFLKSRTESL